jgi:hypothetical protein
MLRHNFHFGTTFPYRLRSSALGAQLFRRTFCYPLNFRSVHTVDEPVLDIHLSDPLPPSPHDRDIWSPTGRHILAALAAKSNSVTWQANAA